MAEEYKLKAVAVPRSTRSTDGHTDHAEDHAEKAIQGLLDQIAETRGRVVASTVISVYHSSTIPHRSTDVRVLIVEEPADRL